MEGVARLGLTVAGLLAGAVAAALMVTSAHAPAAGVDIFLELLVGWSFLAAGAFATRPPAGIGRLMMAFGFAWFASSLPFSNDALVFTAGNLVGSIYAALLAHLVLVFPDGRVRSSLARATLTLAYLDAIAGQFVGLLFAGPATCPECPDNLLAIWPDDRVASAVFDVQLWVAVALLVVIVGIILQRWRAASLPARRLTAPVLASGGLALVAFVGALLAGRFAPAGAALPADRAFHVAIACVPAGFLLGLVRSRLARSEVAELVIELGDAPEPGALRDALARRLHDPSLAIGYWVPDRHRYLDANGRDVQLPQPDEALAATVVRRHGQPLAVLIHDPALLDDPALVDAMGAAAALALENERLHADLRARLDELAASRRRLVEAADAERRRIERDLHDGVQQRLVALSLTLGLAEAKLNTEPHAAKGILAEAKHGLSLALDEVRGLSQGIHPAILTERGLQVALEELTWSAGLPVELASDLNGRLPAPVEAAAYYVVAEALGNVVKHARAAHARVTVRARADRLLVIVADDGLGGADPSRGSGLRGLTDRVAVLGGRLQVVSGHNAGTRVEVELPCA